LSHIFVSFLLFHGFFSPQCQGLNPGQHTCYMCTLSLSYTPSPRLPFDQVHSSTLFYLFYCLLVTPLCFAVFSGCSRVCNMYL
jgi:hypothetical protein